jgi:peptide/nickel transport system permease protein
MKQLKSIIRELLRYPSAIFGVLIILMLLGISVYAIVSIPYDQAISLWRGSEAVWYRNPKFASPEWMNTFRTQKLAKSLALDTRDGTATKEVLVEAEKEQATTTMTFPFDYEADVFPQEMILYFRSTFKEKRPYASITWTTPDGREIRIGDFSIDRNQSFWFSQDQKLKLRINNLTAQEGLFVDDPRNKESRQLLKGRYQVNIKVISFETDANVDAEFVLHGQVAGWAGTDHLRRDLGIALLWGTPIALAFGLIAALLTTFAHMAIAAAGVWYGGWLDELIQRVTEIFLVMPFLPILIMIGTFYSRNLTTIFSAVILLSLFGPAIKNLRATFLQIKEAPFIEAARAYGASNPRVIFLYLIPRLIPLLVPALVTAIPGYVFLEASLAVLGLGDPVLPTWGKVINDASSNGALYKGLYYWVLQPSVLLMVAGLAFAMLGFSLDRIFNPRLRGI